MQTPYEILAVAEDADDEAVKKAYLNKVREYPPERHAEAFQRVRRAFEQIQSDTQRRKHRLFHHAKPDFDRLLRQSLKPGAAQRPDADLLAGALAEAALAELLKTQTPL